MLPGHILLRSRSGTNAPALLHEIRLHVDGSYVETTLQAAWAVIATVKVDGIWLWCGWMSDRLQPPTHKGHCGQSVINAHTAEMVAILHALAAAINAPGAHCTIVYDSTSAGDIAAGVAASKKQHVLARAMISLHHVARTLLHGLCFEHVRSHTGDPLNEAADTVAKAAAKQHICNNPDGTAFAEAVCQGTLDWLWWAVTPDVHAGVMPGLDDHGCTLSEGSLALCMHALLSIPGIPSQVAAPRQQPSVSCNWSLRTVTYNCTTLCKECDRNSLATCFQKDAIHLVGLQETRTDPGPRSSVPGYAAFAAPADKGNLGCQLWVRTAQPVATTEEAGEVAFDVAKAAFICAEPRLLVVVLPAGKQLFACIVGHAPIADSPGDVLDAWWGLLDTAYCKVPRAAIPFFFLDANARFRPQAEAYTATTGESANANADRFKDFLIRHQLDTCSSRTVEDDVVVSWHAPSGHPAHLDYIAYAAPFRDCASTVGRPGNFVDPLGFDHTPVQVNFDWTSAACPQHSRPRFDREAMRTAAGRETITAILTSCPAIPWNCHPEDHLQILNDHLFAGLQQAFPYKQAVARKKHVSPELWQCVRERRHARRLVFRNKITWHRHLLHLLFTQWAATVKHGFMQAGARLQQRWPARCASLRMANARLARVIRLLSALIRKWDQRDAARFTREVLADARIQGPAAMASALRGVMKTGRRYKPPRDANTISSVHASHIPSLPGLALAFMSLPHNKAVGLSCIPTEAYSANAISCAALHMPLIVKIAVTGVAPTLWRGAQAIALAKPGKPPTSLAGWRSIALYDAAAKGLGKALRKQLSASLNTFAAAGQHGSVPGDALPLPAHCVQSYLSAASASNQSCAILFLDGKAAYYALIRQRLFTCHTSDDISFLEGLFRDLCLTDEQQAVLLAQMRQEGALSQAGVHSDLESFLHHCMVGTWFTMGCGGSDAPLFWTRSGTVPGTPLADLLFAFVQANFYRAVQHDLQEQGIIVSFGSGPPAPFPGWADDVAILLPLGPASTVTQHVAAAVRAADHHSRCTGVMLNFEKGKTEALCCFRGRGSRETRRALLSTDHPTLSVELANGHSTNVRIVESYTHLGFRVQHTASCAADVESKIQSTNPVFERLRRTLLRNEELTAREKTELVRSLVISRSCFGAALWNPTTHKEEHLCSTAYHKYWRQAFQHITGHSAIF